jgi:hypothetical protein
MFKSEMNDPFSKIPDSDEEKVYNVVSTNADDAFEIPNRISSNHNQKIGYDIELARLKYVKRNKNERENCLSIPLLF